jgi:hypothetical protein
MPDKDELNQLWCGQTTGLHTKGEDMLAIAIGKADRFDHTIKMRNWRECGASALVTAFFAWSAWRSPEALVRAGYLVVAASGLWIVFYILRYGREAPAPTPDQSLAGFQQALLRKYEHQIRLLKNVKFWYLLPVFSGLLLASVGGMVTHAAVGRPVWPEFIAIALYTAVFGFIWWLNEVPTVKKLRREREALLKQMNAATGEQ